MLIKESFIVKGLKVVMRIKCLNRSALFGVFVLFLIFPEILFCASRSFPMVCGNPKDLAEPLLEPEDKIDDGLGGPQEAKCGGHSYTGQDKAPQKHSPIGIDSIVSIIAAKFQSAPSPVTASELMDVIARVVDGAKSSVEQIPEDNFYVYGRTAVMLFDSKNNTLYHLDQLMSKIDAQKKEALEGIGFSDQNCLLRVLRSSCKENLDELFRIVSCMPRRLRGKVKTRISL